MSDQQPKRIGESSRTHSDLDLHNGEKIKRGRKSFLRRPRGSESPQVTCTVFPYTVNQNTLNSLFTSLGYLHTQDTHIFTSLTNFITQLKGKWIDQNLDPNSWEGYIPTLASKLSSPLHSCRGWLDSHPTLNSRGEGGVRVRTYHQPHLFDSLTAEETCEIWTKKKKLV